MIEPAPEIWTSPLFAAPHRLNDINGLHVTAAHVAQAFDHLAGGAVAQVFEATVEATEAAIANALPSAETTVGPDGITAHALPADRLTELLR